MLAGPGPSSEISTLCVTCRRFADGGLAQSLAARSVRVSLFLACSLAFCGRHQVRIHRNGRVGAISCGSVQKHCFGCRLRIKHDETRARMPVDACVYHACRFMRVHEWPSPTASHRRPWGTATSCRCLRARSPCRPHKYASICA